MRHSIFLLFCFFTFFFSSKTTAQCWDLAWSDEFNGTTLDLTKWTPEIGGGGWGNSELEYYRAENATVSGGFLTITAKQESFGGNSYTSSRLITKNLADFRYGKFEARIKLPVAKGMWPAFWMLPTDNVYGGWPRSGELDIMELIGTYPNRTYGTVHEGTAANGSQLSSGQSTTLSSGTFADDFHVFSTEWSPDLIKIYLDGVLFHTVTPASFAGGKWAFDQRFFMILNLAVGGSWPGSPDGTTTFPQTMVVDYIRVYTSANMVVGNIAVEPTGTATYSTTNIAGATYNWTVPTGATIVSGQGTPSVSVTFSSNANGNVAVTTTTPCGTVNAAIAVTITANTWINPAFENDFNNWTQKPNGLGSYSIASTGAQEGSKAANIQITTAGTNPWDAQLSRENILMQSGVNYTLKFWAKANAVGKRISVAFIHPTNYSNYGNAAFTLTDQWKEYSYSFTPTATTALFNIDLARDAGTYQLDNFVFGKTALLPLELIDFQGKTNNKVNYLTWQIANADGVSHFEVERSSATGCDFQTIGKVFFSMGKNYSFTDNAPLDGVQLYQLKTVDTDGKTQLSKVLSLYTEGGDFVATVFPNPATGHIFIKTTDYRDLKVAIFDETGKKVLENALNTEGVNVSDLPQGIYQLQVFKKDTMVFRQSVTIVN